MEKESLLLRISDLEGQTTPQMNTHTDASGPR